MLFSAHHDANLYLSVTVSTRVTFIVFFLSFTSDCARICIVIASIKNKRFAISRPKHQEPGFMVLCTWVYDHPLVLTYTFYIRALFIFIFIETYFHNHHRSCFNHFKIAFYLYIKYILSNHLMMTNSLLYD